MSYLGPNGITWKNLEEANIVRLPEFKNKKGKLAHTIPDVTDWTIDQWATATGGEWGEFLSFLKQFNRGDITWEEFVKEGGKELADTVIYLSLLAKRIGINMDEVIVDKFNEVSARINSRVYIGNDWEYHLKPKEKLNNTIKRPLTAARIKELKGNLFEHCSTEEEVISRHFDAMS